MPKIEEMVHFWTQNQYRKCGPEVFLKLYLMAGIKKFYHQINPVCYNERVFRIQCRLEILNITTHKTQWVKSKVQ